MQHLITCRHTARKGSPHNVLHLFSYAATPFIAATEWRTGRWQLAFDCLVFVYSLVLLPGLWHKCDVRLKSNRINSKEQTRFSFLSGWV